MPEQIAFGAAESPGLRFATPEDDENKKPNGSLNEIILERLVVLNAERAAEEAAGHVRWLRPDYQIPRFAKGAAAPKSGELDLGAQVAAIETAEAEMNALLYRLYDLSDDERELVENERLRREGR